MPRTLIICAFLLLHMATVPADEPSENGLKKNPIELFEQRIMPIFKSPKPSSCVQCHLASVDLKDYILPSHEKTFVSLRDQGLIDVDHPTESKILELIGMGDQDIDAGARLIHAKTRKAEYDAFAAWITACCKDPNIRSLPKLEADQLANPHKPEPVIAYTRKSRIVDSFTRNIWSQRMRCFPCHTPNELDKNNPKHKKPIERHAQYVKKYGQLMNIFGKTPEATMRQLITNSRRPRKDHLPLINLANPTQSLLVLKPTAKLPAKDDSGELQKPSSALPVSHMGGLKMHVNDQSYKSFIAWIQDYSRVVDGQFSDEDQLPEDNWIPTKKILRLTNAPESWPKLSTVQMFVHAWDDQRGEWTEPIAFTQSLVTPRRMVNGALFLLAPSDRSDGWSQESMLNPGKYLVKAYIDSAQRLAKDPAAFLGPEDFAGQVEIEAHWNQGFPKAERVDGTGLKKQ